VEGAPAAAREPERRTESGFGAAADSCRQSSWSDTPKHSAPDESVRQKESSEGSCSLSSGQKQKWATDSGTGALGGCLKTVSTLSGSAAGMATTCGSGAPGGLLNCTSGPYSSRKVADASSPPAALEPRGAAIERGGAEKKTKVYVELFGIANGPYPPVTSL